MRYLRLLGAALGAVLMLGAAAAAATASAAETEAGLLYLPGESGQVTFTGKGGTGSLTTTAGTVAWESLKLTGTSTQTEKHVTTGTGTLELKGYKLTKGTTKIACNTEGDAKEVILTPVTFTLFNALDTATKKVLEPGIGLTETEFTIKCGAVENVMIKGTFLGLITEVSLTADITTANLHFIKAGETCDTENAFCKKSQEKANELLENNTGSFEKAEIETNIAITLNKMMLIDD